MSCQMVHHKDAMHIEVDLFGDHIREYAKAQWHILFSLN